MFSGLSGRRAGPSYGRKSPSGADRCAAPPGKTERVSPQGYFCRPALPAECHFNTLLFPPLKIRAFAARRTARCKKRILADFERLTMSAESGFRLTRARVVAALCGESGRARQPPGCSAFFLLFENKTSPNEEQRKMRRKGRRKPVLQTVFSGVAEERPRLCAQICASLLTKKMFLPQRCPHLSAKKSAFLRKNRQYWQTNVNKYAENLPDWSEMQKAPVSRIRKHIAFCRERP